MGLLRLAGMERLVRVVEGPRGEKPASIVKGRVVVSIKDAAAIADCMSFKLEDETMNTRRLILTGLAAAPVAGLAAIADAAPAPSSSALAAAIAGHKAARAALEAHYGPDDLPEDLCRAETAASEALATAPCASDAELIEKLRYLLAYEKRLWGGPHIDRPYGVLATALDQHLNPKEGA